MVHASNKSTPDPVKPFVVVLDAGHGGKDPGNLGNGYMEKIIALKIALKAGDLLEANQDIKVIYTRDSDHFVDLFKRGEIANKAKADLFISIHCDSHTSNAHGAGTFVLGLHANKRNFEVAKKENSAIYLEDNFEQRYAQYDINSPESVIGFTIMQEEFLDQSIQLAKSMQDRFANQLKRNDRKVKQAGFIVLHQTFMPSVLVEAGFLTNPSEGAYLNSKKGQEQIAKAIAEAVLEYKNSVRSSSVVSNPLGVSQALPPNQQKETSMEVKKEPATKEMEEQLPKAKEATQKQNIPKQVTPDEVTKAPIAGKELAQKEIAPKQASSDEVPKEQILSKQLLSKGGDNKEISEKLNVGIEFKVQLMAVAKKMELSPENFNGLKPLSMEAVGSLNRYLYGGVSNYADAKNLLLKAVEAGYSTAFIVAYQNGEKLPLSQALKSLELP
ncbi:N-acetylmuramoyl-L-alanine amidase [Flavobacteriaceae bacterium LSUCC0859]|nr:N-acetylmuramoyl-L-alanine amidase [Flavobacteriaceae bacterium LSUCC0859]